MGAEKNREFSREFPTTSFLGKAAAHKRKSRRSIVRYSLMDQILGLPRMQHKLR